jgi:hypothetical protein
VRATPNWQQLVWTRLDKADRELSPIDRIELHAISPEIVRIDPDVSGTIGLGSLAAVDLGATFAQRYILSRRYREQSPAPLFPTAAGSIPHHVIVASRSLNRDKSQQFLQKWRAQTMNCEERNDFALCHGPNFALSMYSAQSLVLEVELSWSCQKSTFTAGHEDSVTCDIAVDTPAAATLRKFLKHSFPTIQTEEDLNPAFFHEWQN